MRKWAILGLLSVFGALAGCESGTPRYSMETLQNWDTRPEEVEQFTTPRPGPIQRQTLPAPQRQTGPERVVTRTETRRAPRGPDRWPEERSTRDGTPLEVAGAVEEAEVPRANLRSENPIDARADGPVLKTSQGTVIVVSICDVSAQTVRCWSPQGEFLSDMANALEDAVPATRRVLGSEVSTRRLVIATADSPGLRLIDPERQTDVGVLAATEPYPGLRKMGDYLFAVLDPAPGAEFAPIQVITRDQDEQISLPFQTGATASLRKSPIRVNFIAEGAPTGTEWSGIRDEVRNYMVVVGGTRLLSSAQWSVSVYDKQGTRITSADALGFPQPGQSPVGFARSSGNSLVVGFNLRREFIGRVVLHSSAPERVEWDGLPLEPRFGR